MRGTLFRRAVVGDTGIEPVTSSVSGKRATAAPIARCCCEVEMGFEPTYTALQAAASPLGHATVWFATTKVTKIAFGHSERMTRFELATSTLARWRSSQLSYIRTENR